MEEKKATRNECRCAQAACGCPSAETKTCTCGDACRCTRTCACTRGCGCAGQ
jgi:hypothetical protein